MKDNFIVENLDASKMTGDFLELIKRAFKEKPDMGDLKKLEKYLEENPGLWRVVFDIEYINQTLFIWRLVEQKAAQIAIQKNMAELKKGLNFSTSSVLEQLLIENIVSTWLNNQWTTYMLTALMGKTGVRFEECEFWERRVSISQGRYLRACESLAKVRRLISRHPQIQVNIASERSQLMNISGDFIK